MNKIPPKTAKEALQRGFLNIVWLSNFQRMETWETSEVMRPLYQTALLLGFEEHEIEEEMCSAAFDEYGYYDDGLTDFVDEVWRQIVADDQDIDAHVREVYVRNESTTDDDA